MKNLLLISSFLFVLGTCSALAQTSEVPSGVNHSIWEAVLKTPFIDTHEHFMDESIRLNGEGNSWLASNDWSALFGSYFQHDFISSGVPPEVLGRFFSDDVDPIEKWAIIEPYWDNVRFTSYGNAIHHTIRILYGISDLNSSTVSRLQERYVALQKPGFYKYILNDVANIESCQVNTLWGKPFNETESPLLLMQDLGITDMFSALAWARMPGPHIELLSKTAGIKVESIDDWYAVINWWFEKYGNYAVAVKSVNAYYRNIDYQPVEYVEASPVFDKILHKLKLTGEELKKLEDHLFWYTTQVAADYKLPIKIHTGYYAGVDKMNLVDVSNNPAAAADICMNGKSGGRDFVFLHMSYPYQDEMVALAKHFSNAYIDLSWAWIIDHLATRNFLKQYLTTAPINKLFAFGGDYLSVEPTVGHAYVARLGIAQVLTELVSENYFSESDAIAIAEKIMYKNAREFYRLDEKEELLKDVKWGTSEYAKKRVNPWTEQME